MFYTGVGARKTPPAVVVLMCGIAAKMASLGYTLRSGGADGADSAFEQGAGGEKDIFYHSSLTTVRKGIDYHRSYNDTMFSKAKEIARTYHPAWHKCSEFAKKLHGRNSFQVLGEELNLPSQYCICWTPDGCVSHVTRKYQTGGTGTAISIADAYKVPIINLAIPSEFDKWNNWAMAA